MYLLRKSLNIIGFNDWNVINILTFDVTFFEYSSLDKLVSAAVTCLLYKSLQLV